MMEDLKKNEFLRPRKFYGEDNEDADAFLKQLEIRGVQFG